MPGRYLPDTNIVIALFADDSNVVSRFRAAEEVYVSSIVLGELVYGALKSARVVANTERVNDFVSALPVLACDAESAYIFGQLQFDLRAIGRPIPDNDLWIAATAMQHDLVLVSRDAHFKYVEGLSLETW